MYHLSKHRCRLFCRKQNIFVSEKSILDRSGGITLLEGEVDLFYLSCVGGCNKTIMVNLCGGINCAQ